MKTKRLISGVSVVLVGILLILAVCGSGAAASDQTEVKLTVNNLTVQVDETIAGWGYQVKVGNDEPEYHTEMSCNVIVTGGKKVQILVRPGQGLTDGWYLEAESVNCSYTIPENKNRVDVENYTDTAASVTINAKRDGYTVFFSAGEHGMVSADKVENVPENSAIAVDGNAVTVNGSTVTAEPESSEYMFTHWSGLPGTLTVTDDLYLTADFEEQVYGGGVFISSNNVHFTETEPQVVTVTNTTGGSVSVVLTETSGAFTYAPALPVQVHAGESVTLQITPETVNTGVEYTDVLFVDSKKCVQDPYITVTYLVETAVVDAYTTVPGMPDLETREVDGKTVGITGPSSLITVTGDTAVIESTTDNAVITITGVASSSTAGSLTKLVLSEDAVITVTYPEKKTDVLSYGSAVSGTYTVELELETVNTNLVTVTGVFNDTVAGVIKGSEVFSAYKPVSMVSADGGNVGTADLNITDNGLHLTIRVAKSVIDDLGGISKVAALHVDGTEIHVADYTYTVDDDEYVFEITGDGFSSYVITVLQGTGVWEVSYHANGGSGVMDSSFVERGESVELPVCTFTAPSGYVFNGWRIGDTVYQAGDLYTPSENVTAYARWKYAGSGSSGSKGVTYCQVQFDSTGGSPVADQYVKEGSLLQRPDDPVNEGFVFAGWVTENGMFWDFADDKVYYSMTLYAKWIFQGDSPASPENPEDPVQPVATPLGVAGVLAGLLGAAAVCMKRRK